jgi:hypothetical protein
MNRATVLCCTGVVWSVAACAAVGDVVTFGAAHDNTLYQNASGAVSNGAGPGFTTGNIMQGGLRRGLISFDIAANVPAGATIQSVSLQLHMSRTVSGAADVSLYPVLEGWGEGTSNAGNNDGQGVPATPGDATWLHRFFNTVFWTNAGGDFAPAASAASSVDQVGFYTWASAGMVADAQSWLDAPAGAFGWGVIIDGAAPGTTKRFDSREATDPTLRPMLTVTYAVPGPGCAGLMGCLAVLSGSRRRRRAL